MQDNKNQLPTCVICGKVIQKNSNYRTSKPPKVHSGECLSILRSLNSRARLARDKQRFEEKPLIKKDRYLEDIERRDYIEGVLR